MIEEERLRRSGRESVSGSGSEAVPATVVPSRSELRESGKSSEEIVFDLVSLGMDFDEACFRAEAAVYTRENTDRIRRESDEACADETVLDVLRKFVMERRAA